MVGGVVRRGRAGDGAACTERAGALVLHERPGVRAAVSATGLRDLRLQVEPYWIDDSVFSFARVAHGRRRTTAGTETVHPLSGDLCGISAGQPTRLVRSGNGRPVVPIQDAGGRCGVHN